MKKIFVSTIIFSMILVSFSCIIFANNLSSDVKSTTTSVGNAIANTANGARNVVGNTENAVENGASNVKDAIVGTTENVANGVENGTNDVIGDVANNNSNYNATRTSTDSTLLGMTSTGWTWLILAIVGIAIVGLVWYYGSQYEHTNYDDGE